MSLPPPAGRRPHCDRHTASAAEEKYLIKDLITVVVQVNGKVRSRIEAHPGMKREEMERLALEDERVKTYINGSIIEKIIVVQDKLINVVLGG